jgi:hypothetical protein
MAERGRSSDAGETCISAGRGVKVESSAGITGTGVVVGEDEVTNTTEEMS